MATVHCPFRQQGAVSLNEHYVAGEPTAHQEDINGQTKAGRNLHAKHCPAQLGWSWSCLANEQHCLPSYLGAAATTLSCSSHSNCLCKRTFKSLMSELNVGVKGKGKGWHFRENLVLISCLSILRLYLCICGSFHKSSAISHFVWHKFTLSDANVPSIFSLIIAFNNQMPYQSFCCKFRQLEIQMFY